MLFSYTYNQNNSNLTLLQSIVITTTTTTTTSTTTSSPSEEEEQQHQVPLPLIDEKLVLNATKNDIIEEEEETCDFFEGSWVYKPESNPLYNVLQCPFLSLQVSCQNNGRPDFEYEHWTWEPKSKAKACLIPKFDGLDMLDRLRDKRVIIVGDSLNRNQWESLACLLYSVLPPTRTTVDIESEFYKVFRSEDYNCTVEFYWSPFLVQLDESKGKGKIVLRLDKLDEASKKWEGADIMVFNGGHWWMHPGKIRAWDVFEHDGQLDETMELESAMEMAMKTWANWVETKVDRRKTRTFFRSITAAHYGKHSCFGITMPLMDEEYSTVHYPKLVGNVVGRVLENMTFPIKYLNITKLTQFRVDAHPGKYSLKGGVVHEDCSHWCLPGVPDQWNRLLYASLVLDKSVIDDENTADLSDITETTYEQINKPDSQVSEPVTEPRDQNKANETEVLENANDVQIPELLNDIQYPKQEEEEEKEVKFSEVQIPGNNIQEPNQEEEKEVKIPDEPEQEEEKEVKIPELQIPGNNIQEPKQEEKEVNIPELQIPGNNIQEQKQEEEVKLPEVQIPELPNNVQDLKQEEETEGKLPDVQIPEPSTYVQDQKQQEDEKEEEECDVSEGKWVYNPESVPPYNELQCPFVNRDFTCQANGRPDSEYVKWSWEPTGCTIPKFNGLDLAERLRGKRLAFVGDSISRNQWESMVCLLYSALPPSKTKTQTTGGANAFRSEEYDFSVEFFWNSFLVQLEDVNGTKVLNLNEISTTSKQWQDADILVFNTGHWWVTQRWDIYRYKGKLIKDMKKNFPFKVAINTWAQWMDANINRTKTRVFFRSYSPVHSCFENLKPLDDYRYGSYPKPIYDTVERTIKSMATEIEYLNITKLTQFRADAHPGYYIHKRGRRLLSRKNKHQGGDCSHWCLPGLPDTWNSILYAKLLRTRKSTDEVQNDQQLGGPQDIEILKNPVLVPTKQLEEPRNLDLPNTPVSIPIEQVALPSDNVQKANKTVKEECDIFEGRWVYDPQDNRYTESTCPFINDQFTCQQNGRQDFGYANWRWEATGCQIPRFDGKDMLERLRGKRVILVGDSINKNQFESLSCLLYSSVPAGQAEMASNGAQFRAKQYDFTLESYWSPFLIQLQQNYINGSKTLRLDTISDTAEKWKGADIIVFNSGHWWTHKRVIRVWDSYEHNGKLTEDMEIERAFEIALQTWAQWIDENIDSSKTKVFFRSVSPVHTSKYVCLAKTEPLSITGDYSTMHTYPDGMKVALEKTIKNMMTPVKYLNITQLSKLRIDAHPGYHGRPRPQRRMLRSAKRKHKKPKKSIPEQTEYIPETPKYIPEQPKQPRYIPKQPQPITQQPQPITEQPQVVQHDQDCNHWCLPGLPDTWNKLLYASLVLDS
ncbi:hypothetical protein ACFE04_018865 [Oxalis oulophora]